MCVHFTCVTHVIVIRRALVRGDTTGIADSSGILAHFGFRHWCSVSAKVPCFHGRGGLLKEIRTESAVTKWSQTRKRPCSSRRACVWAWNVVIKHKRKVLPGTDHHRSPSRSPPWRRGTVPRCGPSHGSWCFDDREYQSRKGSVPYLLKTCNSNDSQCSEKQKSNF